MDKREEKAGAAGSGSAVLKALDVLLLPVRVVAWLVMLAVIMAFDLAGFAFMVVVMFWPVLLLLFLWWLLTR